MRKYLFAAAIFAGAATVQASAQSAPLDLGAEASAIQQVESGQIAAMQRRDAANAVTVYAPDAVLVGEDGVAVRGQQAIAAAFQKMLADPAFVIEYRPGATIVGAGGDMAYSTAGYSMKQTDPQSDQPVTMRGSNLTVWRKQPDGSWKIVADSNPAAKVQ